MIDQTCAPPCVANNATTVPNAYPTPAGDTKGSSCDDPLFVQICDPSPAPQVEISDIALGCAFDVGGNPIGVVVLSRTVDETTGVETQVRVMHPYDGSPAVSPYAGVFGPCDVPCETLATRGLVAAW